MKEQVEKINIGTDSNFTYGGGSVVFNVVNIKGVGLVHAETGNPLTEEEKKLLIKCLTGQRKEGE